MQRQLVKSTNVRSVGYDASIGTLEIEFHSGGIYQYFSVPEAVYIAFINRRGQTYSLRSFPCQFCVMSRFDPDDLIDEYISVMRF
jgi:hypothetical protein